VNGALFFPQQDEARLNKVWAYLIATIGQDRSSADLRAAVKLGMAPENYERKLVSYESGVRWK
jgi:hypothetical protein